MSSAACGPGCLPDRSVAAAPPPCRSAAAGPRLGSRCAAPALSGHPALRPQALQHPAGWCFRQFIKGLFVLARRGVRCHALVEARAAALALPVCAWRACFAAALPAIQALPSTLQRTGGFGWAAWAFRGGLKWCSASWPHCPMGCEKCSRWVWRLVCGSQAPTPCPNCAGMLLLMQLTCCSCCRCCHCA